MINFAQTYTTTTSSSSVSIVFLLLYLAVIVAILMAQWRIYTKAGEPGWAILVPIYNIIVLLRIVGLPLWYLILLLIPFVNIFVLIYVYYKLAQSFGHGIGMTILELFVVGFFILGFGSAKYVGPGGSGAKPGTASPPKQPPAPAAPTATAPPVVQ